jgi:DNA-binding NtrC family response regulator
MRVLLVEDDASLRELLFDALVKVLPDAEIDTANTADEIISFMNTQVDNPKFHYQLIISDVRLTGESSGFDLWRITESLYPKTRFLFMSGLSTLEFLQHVEGDSKCPPFLAKPFQIKDFQQLVRQLLEEDLG